MPRCLDDIPWRSLRGMGDMAPDILNVGDYKNEPLTDGTPAVWRLIGFRHDVTRGGVVVPTTWEMVDCLPNRYPWNSNDTTKGSWAGTQLCKRMNDKDGDIFNLIPLVIRELAVPVIKLTADTYTGENNIVESEHQFWIKSEKETYGRNIYSAPGEGHWYEYYRLEDVAWGKTRNGSPENTMLRSPFYHYASAFCAVNTTGSASYTNARYSIGLAPAFAL